jgi:hypothetical protein
MARVTRTPLARSDLKEIAAYLLKKIEAPPSSLGFSIARRVPRSFTLAEPNWVNSAPIWHRKFADS